jgi:hypothetical protein
VLTNRHHYRHSDRFQAEFGCTVLASDPGLHEFGDDRPVQGFAFGDELADGITALEVGSICPDESALHIELGDGFLAVADGVVNYDGLRFVPDNLIGDDPEGVKEGLRAAYRRLCELEFDGLMCAHGDPIPTAGREKLREFVSP